MPDTQDTQNPQEPIKAENLFYNGLKYRKDEEGQRIPNDKEALEQFAWVQESMQEIVNKNPVLAREINEYVETGTGKLSIYTDERTTVERTSEVHFELVTYKEKHYYPEGLPTTITQTEVDGKPHFAIRVNRDDLKQWHADGTLTDNLEKLVTDVAVRNNKEVNKELQENVKDKNEEKGPLDKAAEWLRNLVGEADISPIQKQTPSINNGTSRELEPNNNNLDKILNGFDYAALNGSELASADSQNRGLNNKASENYIG